MKQSLAAATRKYRSAWRQALLVPVLVALACAGVAPAMAQQAPVVFAPGIISGPAHDAAPAFMPDGKTVYFGRSNQGGSTILVSHLRQGRWSEPQVASFSGQWSDMEPAMSPDGKFLVFVSSRPADGTGKPIDGMFNGKLQEGAGGNLWRVERQGEGWSKPVRLPEVINRSGTIFAPSVAADGSLYFMDAVGEKGRFRLFRAQYVGGSYQAPQPLSFSEGNHTDVDPAVAPDESYMVFSSSRAPARGLDLFIVFRRNGRWEAPLHLGDQVNSEGSDAEARLSPDGKTLYFSSERVMPIHYPRTPAQAVEDLQRIQAWDNGNYNIWQVSLKPWLEGSVRASWHGKLASR
jgi:Tol biopolymer transport system component